MKGDEILFNKIKHLLYLAALTLFFPIIASAAEVTDINDHLINGGTITGTVDLDGRADDKSGAMLWLDGVQLAVTTAADGTFTLPAVSAGSHVVKATMPCYLPAEAAVTVTDNQTVSVNLHLIGGDITGDGTINIFDLVAVGAAFNGTDPAVDINNDGYVNIFDLVLVGTNFGLTI
jgi:hypothetical protein